MDHSSQHILYPLLHPIPISSLQVQLADVKLAADSRDQRRVETPPRVLMKTRAAADRAARAAAAAANGEGLGHANSRYCILMKCYRTLQYALCQISVVCGTPAYFCGAHPPRQKSRHSLKTSGCAKCAQNKLSRGSHLMKRFDAPEQHSLSRCIDTVEIIHVVSE